MEEQSHKTEKTKVVEKSAAVKNIHVLIHAPYKVYYDGQAQSISAENKTGPFDVLGKHHNFMTLLSECDVVVRNGDTQEKFSIQRGVMHVKQDEVIVFLDV